MKLYSKSLCAFLMLGVGTVFSADILPKLKDNQEKALKAFQNKVRALPEKVKEKRTFFKKLRNAIKRDDIDCFQQLKKDSAYNPNCFFVDGRTLATFTADCKALKILSSLLEDPRFDPALQDKNQCVGLVKLMVSDIRPCAALSVLCFKWVQHEKCIFDFAVAAVLIASRQKALLPFLDSFKSEYASYVNNPIFADENMLHIALNEMYDRSVGDDNLVANALQKKNIKQDIVLAILKLPGIDVNATVIYHGQKRTPLGLAVSQGFVRVVQAILNNPSLDINLVKDIDVQNVDSDSLDVKEAKFLWVSHLQSKKNAISEKLDDSINRVFSAQGVRASSADLSDGAFVQEPVKVLPVGFYTDEEQSEHQLSQATSELLATSIYGLNGFVRDGQIDAASEKTEQELFEEQLNLAIQASLQDARHVDSSCKEQLEQFWGTQTEQSDAGLAAGARVDLQPLSQREFSNIDDEVTSFVMVDHQDAVDEISSAFADFDKTSESVNVLQKPKDMSDAVWAVLNSHPMYKYELDKALAQEASQSRQEKDNSVMHKTNGATGQASGVAGQFVWPVHSFASSAGLNPEAAGSVIHTDDGFDEDELARAMALSLQQVDGSQSADGGFEETKGRD